MKMSTTCNIDHEEDCEAVPPKPTEPLPSECCGSGCTPCVFDIYEEDLKKWEQQRKAALTGNLSSKYVDSVLSRSEFRAFMIESVAQLTVSVQRYRFGIPDNRTLGLQTGQHIILRSKMGSPALTRQYTPVSPLDAQGYFDVAIKIYKDGKMSNYIKTWQVGDMVEWKGPFGNFTYLPNKFKTIYMLAAGTGIAPMIQVIHTILNNDQDETRVNLLFSCCTYEDILMKDELDKMRDYWNFSVKYFVTKDDDRSKARYTDRVHYGRIDKDVLENECPARDKNTFFLICGTKSFDKDMINHLTLLGCNDTMFYKF